MAEGNQCELDTRAGIVGKGITGDLVYTFTMITTFFTTTTTTTIGLIVMANGAILRWFSVWRMCDRAISCIMADKMYRRAGRNNFYDRKRRSKPTKDRHRWGLQAGKIRSFLFNLHPSTTTKEDSN